MPHHRKSEHIKSRNAATPPPRRISPWRLLAASCALAACALPALPARAGQTAKPSPAIAQKPASNAAQTPASLASQPPAAASVSFQNGKLTVKANNSTLRQILQSITAHTGMKIQGSPGDHRVFGDYGPGQPREILAQLLTGFNFNYLLVGTAHNGSPQKLILTGAAPTGPAPTPPAPSIQPAPQSPPPRPPFRPHPANHQPSRTPKRAHGPHRVRTPQEILKELEAMHAHQGQQNHQQ